MERGKLKELLDGLPAAPGVYLMKNADGEILYIGKAKNLRSRVRSYFAKSGQDTRFLARNVRRLIDDIEIVLTASEKEALLLENNFIKAHTPRFNIKLRDDKEYICLRLDARTPWPKLEVVRRPKKDGALYFGPYHSASSARETLKVVKRNFKLRSCKDGFMKNRTRPCIQHQMHRCLAPCTLPVVRDEYLRQVTYVRLFLQGRKEDLIEELKAEMAEAADNLAYEKAAMLRDQIQAVTATLAPQRVVVPGGIDQDVVGMSREGDQVELVILEIRGGRLEGSRDYHWSGQEFPDDDILSSFLMQRYGDEASIPKEIIASKPLQAGGPIAEILSEKRGAKVRITCPKRGQKVRLATMAEMNAAQRLKERLKDVDLVKDRLEAVQKRLKLPKLPARIECVDISHLGGTGTVGAISVLVDARIRKDLARTYRIKNAPPGDDYAAMREVLERRFSRARAGEAGWEAPDLLMVDGGRGQLSVALAVLSDLDITGQPVVALAKERARDEEAWQDRVFLPMRKNPIPLKARVSSLHLLALARDEAHRLAVGFQRKVRRKTIASELDAIPGIGPKTKRMLLRTLGSVSRIKAASLDDLAKVEGVGVKLARKIKDGVSGEVQKQ
jgi:excinuclease ABC subunit C